MAKVISELLSRRDFLKLGAIAAANLKLSARAFTSSSLREVAARRGLQVGTGISGWWFSDPQYQEKYKELVAREFNFVVVNWGFYWPEVEPVQNQFAFSTADKQIAFARQKKMLVRGHPLVFPTASHAIADWIIKGNFSRARLIEILRNHITRLVSNYRGKISEWVVVNEPYIHPYRPHDIFYQTIGRDYLEIAFRAARKADPFAKLIYNDTDNHTAEGMTTKLTRSNAQRLKAEGLVDGVGVQMHLDAARPPAKKDVVATMKSYGVPVYVTEMDVNMSGVQEAIPKEKERIQAGIYREMVEACLESGVCKSLTFWETGDKYAWAEWPKEAPYASPNADMTLFDDNLEPKAGYEAIRDVLSQKQVEH